jgi:hypothetical protein
LDPDPQTTERHEEPYQPQGYCPGCGYAVDPGTCPECGGVVSEVSLRKFPPHVVVRRRLRRIGLVLLLLGLILGGRYVYLNVNWLQFVPNRLLLVRANEWPRGDAELLRRCRIGRLSDKQKRKAFADSYEVEPWITGQVTGDESWYVSLQYQPRGLLAPALRGSLAARFPVVDKLEASFRRREADESEAQDVPVAAYLYYGITARLPPLEPGEYTVTISGELQQAAAVCPGMPAPYAWPFQRELPLTVRQNPQQEDADKPAVGKEDSKAKGATDSDGEDEAATDAEEDNS